MLKFNKLVQQINMVINVDSQRMDVEILFVQMLHIQIIMIVLTSILNVHLMD